MRLNLACWFLTVASAGGIWAGAASGESLETAPIGYIVGPRNSEDVLQIGNSRWLLASGLMSWTDPSDSRGHIYLVDRKTRGFEVFFPREDSVSRLDAEMFPDCPGPIDPENFSAHGFAMKETSPGQHRLYMTGHGAREAIEVFEIDARTSKPAMTWVGCVPLPPTMWGNSVAILDDGGFLATKSKDSTNPDAFVHLVEGRLTGAVYEWRPGGKVNRIAGTDLSGPNGIAVSQDQRWIYVAAMGSRELVRFDWRDPGLASESTRLTIYPDNLHWGDDGQLYTVGRNYHPGAECPWLNCGTGWSIVRIDPETLEAERVAGVDQTEPLQAPSSVSTAGDLFWVGNFDGDRIGYMRRPTSIPPK